MFLAEISSSISFNSLSDLESHNMNQNYDWIDNSKKRYSETELLDIDIFVNRNLRINNKKNKYNSRLSDTK